MTEAIFRDDPYRRETPAAIVRADEGGIVLDRTVFYPRGGGQAGDAGEIVRGDGGIISIVDTVKGGPPDEILHVPAPDCMPVVLSLQAGEPVTARIDWERRHRHMRFHTATHLLCAVVPRQTNGCSITSGYARLDFDMVEPLDREHLERELVLLKLKVRPEQTDVVRGYVVRTGGRVLDPATDCFVVELTASEVVADRFERCAVEPTDPRLVEPRVAHAGHRHEKLPPERIHRNSPFVLQSTPHLDGGNMLLTRR